MNIKINYNLILFISIAFSLVVGSGVYGYGVDYYVAYNKSNLNWGSKWTDTLGWKIATFTFYGKHLGVYLVSFLLSISFGTLLKFFFEYREQKSILFFIIIMIIGLHTWPIIMSTSNVMRQGISMSLIFLSFSYLLRQKNFKSFFFISISIFTHKSGILFLIILILFFFIKFIFNLFKTNKYLGFYYLILGILIFFSSLTFKLKLNISEESRIIQGDYRYFFFFISLIYILTFSYKFYFLKHNNISLYLYLFSFISPVFLFLGLNWQYERLMMMMMIIPYIIMFSVLLNKNSSYFSLIFLFSTLLSLTILNNQYSVGLN
jgi:hypothetical protein